MFRNGVFVLLIVCILVASSGCIGGFNLTRQIYDWNAGLGKIGSELVFLGLVILPVYELTMIGDALIFNSIQYWGGGTVFDPPENDIDTVLEAQEW